MFTISCVKLNAGHHFGGVNSLALTVKEIVGKNISRLKKRDGINSSEIARAVGVSVSVVSHWINGVNLPGAEALDMMRDKLKWSLADLFQEQEAETKERQKPSFPVALKVVEHELGIKFRRASPKSRKNPN